MDLAWRGIAVVVAELRHCGEAPSVKCNHVAARTMEMFRRLGVAASVRDAGLPHDYPNDVAYRLTTTGTELARIPIPCRADRYTATDGPDTWWPTPEPPHRINQIYLEPILFAHAEAMASCTILNRTRVVGFNQSETSVLVQAEALDGGETIEIRCDYLVGCEGGRSETRRAIGAKLLGDAEIGRVQSTLIRAPSLLGNLRPSRPGARSRSTRVAAATSTRSTAVRHGSSTTISAPTNTILMRSTAMPACARFSASAPTSTTKSFPKRTGPRVDWSPTAFVTAAPSSAGTPRICGCRWPAMA